MSTQTSEWLEVAANILLRCWMIGVLLILSSLAVFMLTGEVLYDLVCSGLPFDESSWLAVSVDTLAAHPE